MSFRQTAAPLVPRNATLDDVKEAAARCRACPLWERGTQTVFGHGLPTSRLILVGEQPGDQEDRKGLPFVGPAGRLLDTALERAGIERRDAYVTNVVKHFKWTSQGKRRLHTKPNSREIGACLPWLDAEIDLIRPEIVVTLGSTATQALLGKTFLVTRDHGKFFSAPRATRILVTAHPSAILRAPSDDQRSEEMECFVDDLKIAAAALRST